MFVFGAQLAVLPHLAHSKAVPGRKNTPLLLLCELQREQHVEHPTRHKLLFHVRCRLATHESAQTSCTRQTLLLRQSERRSARCRQLGTHLLRQCHIRHAQTQKTRQATTSCAPYLRRWSTTSGSAYTFRCRSAGPSMPTIYSRGNCACLLQQLRNLLGSLILGRHRQVEIVNVHLASLRQEGRCKSARAVNEIFRWKERKQSTQTYRSHDSYS